MIIMKVQRPISTNVPTQPWLLYTEERDYEGQVPDAKVPEMLKQLMNGDDKAYFAGSIEDDGQFRVVRRVMDQDW